MKIITENRKARHDYQILETFEAGIQLLGSELKPIRSGSVQLKDSYVEFFNDELFLLHSHISVYQASSYNNHEPERKRKLLMNKEEIRKLYVRVKEKGYTIIPLKMYFKKSLVKVEIAVAKGKQKGDKRESIKKRDVSRDLARASRRDR
jgi:SsrA-binding protein